MRLLSWNVQWCRGIDGRVDPKRIAAEAKRIADPDVACLQEIAVNFGELEGSSGEDQVELLRREFAGSGYQAFFVPAVDLPGKNARRQFGNMILARLPVGRVSRHLLPWPAAPDVQSMQRGAVEAVIETGAASLRVVGTHLEYYSAAHRAAQIDRLCDLARQAAEPKLAHTQPGTYESHAQPSSLIVCGDFNLKPDDPHHRRMLDGGFVDAWQALRGGEPRQATFHVHDGETPYCCDYVFVTPNLVPRLRSIRIDAATQASDHQPVIVELR